jgi:hypothetical protein
LFANVCDYFFAFCLNRLVLSVFRIGVSFRLMYVLRKIFHRVGGHFPPLHLKDIEVSDCFTGSLIRDKTFAAFATMVFRKRFHRYFNNA